MSEKNVHINLSREPQISHISAKANQGLGFLKRHLHKAASQTKLIAYNTLVRPQLKYASHVWNPRHLYLEEKREVFQNLATRFVLRNYTSYQYHCIEI